MKKIFYLLTVIWFGTINTFSQNIDSLLMDDFSGINKKLNKIIYTLEVDNKKLMNVNDSLLVLNHELMEKLSNIELGVNERTDETNRIILDENAQVKQEIGKAIEKTQSKFVILYTLLGFMVLLIIYLIIILRITRRESIEYLLAQTDGLSQQNYEILGKAEDIKKIKTSLKEIVKQKKLEKSKKKKSKKKGKK